MDMAFWPDSEGKKSANLKILFHNSYVLMYHQTGEKLKMAAI